MPFARWWQRKRPQGYYFGLGHLNKGFLLYLNEMKEKVTSPALIADEQTQEQRKQLATMELPVSGKTKELISALNAFRSAIYGYCAMWEDLGAGKLETYRGSVNDLHQLAEEAMGIATSLTGEWLMGGLLANDFEEL